MRPDVRWVGDAAQLDTVAAGVDADVRRAALDDLTGATCVLVGPEADVASAVEAAENAPVVACCRDGTAERAAVDAGASRTVRWTDDPTEDAVAVGAALDAALAAREGPRDGTGGETIGDTGARLSDALDTLQDIFFVFDLGGSMVAWNDRAVEVSGYDDATIAEMEPLAFIAPEDRERIGKTIQEVVQQEEVTAEAKFLTADGERIPYEFTGSLLTDADGEPAAICGIGRDVTERELRERVLREQADRLEVLNHVNAVIRDVNEALVRAETRDEIETAVCEHLASATPYSFAWIGSVDPAGDRVDPRTAAGDEAGYLDDRPGDSDEGVTAIDAARTGEVQVAQSIVDDPTFAPWREAALEHGFRSAAAVPLTYRDTTYGVLCLYAPRANAFAETEREVLAELGETIGYAIAAAEQRRALVTDAVVEVELGFDGGPFFARLAAASDCRFELEGTVESDGGQVAEFFSVQGDPERVREAAADLPGEATVVAEYDDGAVVRLRPSGPSLAALVAYHGGVLRRASADASGAQISVELPTEANVRAMVEGVRGVYPSVDLRAQHERERTSTRGLVFRDRLDEALTDRQREVLETAYHAGFFGWPRTNSAEDVAEMLDISAPTFHEHVRRAEQKLVDAYFESGTPSE